MPQFRADFNVKGNLILPAPAEALTVYCDDPACKIIISNAEIDTWGNVPYLKVQVVASSESIESVPDAFRGVLERQLDLLAFVTNSRFIIEQSCRVVEWDPYQKKRAVMIMSDEFDPCPPDPKLESKSIEAIQAILKSGPADYVKRALHFFRYGMMLPQPEDQFIQFWLSIETIAEGGKKGTKVPIPCPKCGGPLKCEQCNETPRHTPMATQAIRELINRIVKDKPEETYKSLSGVRHSLLHGRSLESIKAKVNLKDMVNVAAAVAWRAILTSMPDIEGQLNIISRGSHVVGGSHVVSGRLIAAGPVGRGRYKGEFEYDGLREHPAENEIPDLKIDCYARFKNPSENTGA
jgi:hypothetical protein